MKLQPDVFFQILWAFSDTFSRFLLLYFLGFALNLWLLGAESRPGPGQVSQGGFAAAHPRVGAHALTGDGLAWGGAGGVIPKVRLRVGTHGWGAFGPVRWSISQPGQVDVLAAQISDRISTVGHQNVVPWTQRGGGEALRAVGVLFGSSGRHDHGVVRRHCLHGALEGLEDAIALLLLFLLPGLDLSELPPLFLHHLLPCVCQAPAEKQEITRTTLKRGIVKPVHVFPSGSIRCTALWNISDRPPGNTHTQHTPVVYHPRPVTIESVNQLLDMVPFQWNARLLWWEKKNSCQFLPLLTFFFLHRDHWMLSVNTLHCWMNEFIHLHRPPEVSYGHPHGPVFVNVAEEIPQTQLAFIQIILQKGLEMILWGGQSEERTAVLHEHELSAVVVLIWPGWLSLGQHVSVVSWQWSLRCLHTGLPGPDAPDTSAPADA